MRDCYLAEGGDKVVLFTRNGGGNRDCWKLKGCKKDVHDRGCMVFVNSELTKHPEYLRDYDDDYDKTFAYFEFRVPPALKPLAAALVGLGAGKKPAGDRFKALIEKMKDGDMSDPEVVRAMEAGRDIMDRIAKALIDGNGGGVIEL